MAYWLKERKTQGAPCTECVDNMLNILAGEVAELLSHGSFMFLSVSFLLG
jgi:hypothetical protein